MMTRRRKHFRHVTEIRSGKRKRLDSNASTSLSGEDAGDPLPGPSGEHGLGGGGQPLTSDTSEEELESDDSHVEDEEDDDDDDDDVEDILKQLPERFKNSEIDLEQIGSRAMGICVIQKEKHSFDICYARCESVVPVAYKTKWLTPKEKSGAERLKEFTNILKERTKFLVFDPDAMEWKKKKDIKKLKEMLKSKGAKEKGKKIQKKTRRTDKKRTTTERKKKTTKCAKNRFVDKMIDDLRLDLKIAFLYKMHNSKGRDFMRDLLASAAYVCFGENYKDSVSILSVGTSPYKPEGVRVHVHCATYKLPDTEEEHVEIQNSNGEDELLEAESTENRCKRRKDENSERKKRSVQKWVEDSGSYKVSSAKSSGRSSGKSSSSIYPNVKVGYVYPDVVVASMSGNFAKYIMVVDMKSVSLQASEIAQVRKQMVGAGIHQSEVFGIVMNWEEARILKMTVKKEDKKVTFTEECFHLIEAAGEPPDRIYKVNEEELCDFFVYLVAIIDYGFERILEVKYE